MGEKILVAYATKHGSTQEVVEAVASALSGQAHEVQMRPAANPGDVDAYGLVVLGGPICSGRWHKDAHRFLKRQRQILEARPVAIFALRPRKPPMEGTWPRSQGQLDNALAKHPWPAPTATAVFGGVDPPKDAPHS
jgi:menaquinone-dependent protoporphyrinogen oxidase